jgi:hypothetical protein
VVVVVLPGSVVVGGTVVVGGVVVGDVVVTGGGSVAGGAVVVEEPPVPGTQAMSSMPRRAAEIVCFTPARVEMAC